MKANELMIGDWVICKYYQDRPCYMQFGIVDFQKRGYEFCEPVPLTAEILEKNGFEELMSEGEEVAAKFGRIPEPTGVWQYGFGQFDSVSYLPKRSFLSVKFMEGYMADMANIKYVHELQHALRLCGVEKEIIL